MTAPKYSGRVWAPFGAFSDKAGRGEARRRIVAFYCHGYRQEGEHYHESFEELLDCDRMGDEPHLRELRAARARRKLLPTDLTEDNSALRGRRDALRHEAGE